MITQHEIYTIHQIDDDSTRNNEITIGYHDLSKVLTGVTRSGSANWCAWAKWTSKTIGVGIRWGEARDMAKARAESTQDEILNRWAATRAVRYFVVGTFLKMTSGATRMASRHLADGNRDVFYEVGTAVVRMGDRFGDADRLDRAALDEYLEGLHNVAPARSLGPAPLGHMRDAMRCFVLARFARTRAARDQLVLAANVHLAAYEQLRLQAVVERSLWAPVDFVFRPLGWIGRRLPAPIRGPLGVPVKGVRTGFRWVAVRVATRYVLVVITKDEVIRLGRPMPPARGQTAVFPPPYDQPTQRDLERVLTELAGDVDVTKALARIWTTYPERVHFTAALFRSRHHEPSLHEFPMGSDEKGVVLGDRHQALETGEEWAELA